MEESAAPKTKKATIEWLRAQLDAKEVELFRCRQKNEELYEALENKNDELYLLGRELDRTKEKLAESRAWAEIEMDEREALRSSFHRLLTSFEMDRL